MTEKLKILILEDSPDDCELMERELRKGKISFAATRVETEEDYIREIENSTPDILLVDYALPSFDGLSALRISMEKRPGVPFIFVSGVIEEETAIESLKAGATDYVFKHRLSRLVPVVKRALREVEERGELERAERALRDSERRYRELVENINDVIFSQDAEGRITYISPALERMSKYKTEDLVGKSFIELIHPEDLPGLMESYTRTMEGSREPWEFRMFDKDGSVRWVRTSSRSLVRDGEIAGLLGILTDITERKLDEERIRHLNLVIRSIRNVNQLITKEKDRDRLLQGACDNLVENRGYYKCWIALLGSDGRLLKHKEAGWGDALSQKIDMAEKGKHALMVRRTLEQPGVAVVMDPARECFDCPLSSYYEEGMAAMTSRLEYEGTVYGLISVIIPGDLASDSEEQSLFLEVAEDIAFALHNIEMEKERDASQRDLAERIKEMSCLYRINEIGRREDYSIDDFLRETVRIMPDGWQFPELTGCRIVFEGKEYRTDNFRETEWKQEDDIIINRERAGKIEVCLLEPPHADEEPFLHGEEELIEAIAYTHAVIIHQWQTVEALRKSEEKYRTILEQMVEGYFESDLKGNITFVNKSVCEAMGYEKDEFVGMNYRQITGETNAQKVWQVYNDVYRSGEPKKNAEQDLIRKNGSRISVEGSVDLIRDRSSNPIGFRSVVHDITDRKKAEEQIRQSLREKEIMLQEIHHRVKNNMQIISSMLGLQKKYIRDERDIELFRDSQSRIRSMALVHEKLYRSRNLARIDFAEYTRDLVDQLLQFYNVKKMDIDFKIEFESIYFGVDIAIPCALIINELVSNSLKHAFLDGMKGILYVHLTKDGDMYLLTVSDNGIGFPKGIDFQKTESLGLQLVDAFVRQLKGSISLERKGGTSFNIAFKDKKAGKGIT